MVFVLEHVVVRILALIRLNVHRLNDGKQMIEVRRHGGGRKREREKMRMMISVGFHFVCLVDRHNKKHLLSCDRRKMKRPKSMYALGNRIIRNQ